MVKENESSSIVNPSEKEKSKILGMNGAPTPEPHSYCPFRGFALGILPHGQVAQAEGTCVRSLCVFWSDRGCKWERFLDNQLKAGLENLVL